MGKSLITFKGRGFWTPTPWLIDWAGQLFMCLREDSDSPRWLLEETSEWAAPDGGFLGGHGWNLDLPLNTEKRGAELVRVLTDRFLPRLQVSSAIDECDLRVLRVLTWYIVGLLKGNIRSYPRLRSVPGFYWIGNDAQMRTLTKDDLALIRGTNIRQWHLSISEE